MAGRTRPRRGEAGATLLETALTMPALLLLTLGLVQVALWAHALNVAGDAASFGAREAATAQGNLRVAVATTQDLLQSGLGAYAAGFTVQGQDSGPSIVFDVQGSIPLLLPWLGTAALPVHAERVARKEVRYAP